MQLADAIILGDWGTTNLRLWLVGPDGTILDTVTSQDGAKGLAGSANADIFDKLTRPWRKTNAPSQAILCGMVGRKGGWIEAPYLSTDNWGALPRNLVQAEHGDMAVFVVPGLKTIRSDDVMRGEETQILGLVADTPDFTGTICMPGTHSKWCDLSNGKITDFRTELTGELFSLLSEGSTLRDAIEFGHCDDAFNDGVREALKEQDAMQRLFSVRANWLLNNTRPEAGYSRLSGLLIGAEIARACRKTDLETVALVGANTLVDLYARALGQAGVAATIHSGNMLVIQGLQRIAQDARDLIHG